MRKSAAKFLISKILSGYYLFLKKITICTNCTFSYISHIWFNDYICTYIFMLNDKSYIILYIFSIYIMLCLSIFCCVLILNFGNYFNFPVESIGFFLLSLVT